MRRTLNALAVAVLLAAGCTATEEPRSAEPTTDVATRRRAHDVSCRELDRYIERARRGHFPGRSVDLALVAHEPNYIGPPTAAVHTGPFDFLAEVPLIVYGPPFVDAVGSVDEAPTMADVAPTIARLIGFDGFAAPDGRALTTGISARGRPPRLVVTVVWDGGGWNTLRRHPDAWPFLRSLIDGGVSFRNMTIGSTPSVTPPIHVTLGTGAFPRRHGIPSVTMYTPDGRFINPMEDNSPRWIEVPTLGDVYDKALGNRPLVGVVATVNWHFGMIGRGTLHPGGDRDLAALFNSAGSMFGDPTYYEIPDDLSDPAGLEAAAEDLDVVDGERDGRWRGNELDDLEVRYATPATAYWMGDRLRAAIDSRNFGRDRVSDLLYTNFKSIDDAGHRWGMETPEMADVIRATDKELKRLVTHLDERVGRERWALIVTSDHGTMRFAERSGGWAIRGSELRVDLNRAFPVEGSTPLFGRVTSAGIYLNDDVAEEADVDMREVGRWLLDYTAEDNLFEMGEVPAYYRDKADVPLFDAVLHEGKVAARSCGG